MLDVFIIGPKGIQIHTQKYDEGDGKGELSLKQVLEYFLENLPSWYLIQNNLCGRLQDMMHNKNLTIVCQNLLFLTFGSTLFLTSNGCMWQQLHRLDK